MAISDTIQSMKTHTSNAYNAIQTKGGTIPTNKNLANLEAAVNSITGGGVEEVATLSELKNKVTAANVGNYYLYKGTTTGQVTNGDIYQIEADGAIKFVKSATADLTITANLTNCHISSESPTTIKLLGNATLAVSAERDFLMPYSITVTGASYTYTRDSGSLTGTITLKNATDNVTITIKAELDYDNVPAADLVTYLTKTYFPKHGISIFKPVITADEITAIRATKLKWSEIDDVISKAYEAMTLYRFTLALFNECSGYLKKQTSGVLLITKETLGTGGFGVSGDAVIKVGTTNNAHTYKMSGS